MGPLRKSRSVNKRYSDMNEVSPSKDVENGKSGNNRACLSLPERTASVVGLLIAMMTDHYSNMAGSDDEQESDDGVGTSVMSGFSGFLYPT